VSLRLKLMVSAPLPAAQSPLVVSLFALALAMASRSVHLPLPPVVLLPRSLTMMAALGAARAGMVETTFQEETETDLFGEQTVLCGGVTQLIQLGFETLVEAGYQPEVAYYECLHELKLITDLIWEGGIERMHYSISDTAEYGSHAIGPKVVDEHVRENMRAVLGSIQDGTFVRDWAAEMDRGQPVLDEYRAKLAETQIEKVGARLRALNVREEAAEVHGVG